MICKNCGNENDDSDLFCRNCGKKLEKDSRPKINLSKDIVSSGKKTENSVADTTTGENRPKINLLKKSISKNEKTENNVADTHTEENKRTNIILHNSVSDTVSADNSFGDNQSENNKTDIHRNGIIKPVQQNIPVDNTVTNNTVYADNNLTNNNYVQEESVFCRYCGKKLDKTDRFCDRCGKSVFEQPLSPDYTQNPMPYGVPPQSVKHKKRTVVVVVVSLIVMVVMCFVVRAVYEEIQVKKAADEMLSMMENSSYDENSKPKSAVTTVKAEKTNAVATEQHTTVKKSSGAISSTKTTTAKKAPSISGSITKQKSTGDGYDIYINVSGSYDYYEYEYYEASPDGNVNLTDSGTENKSSFRVSGFSAGVPYVYADIIPYNDDGTSGSKITVRLDIDTNTETKQLAKKNATISSCNKLGLINCHGGTVAGYTTSYVAEGGAVDKVRSSLGNGWHIVAYNTCTSMGITWYELWDSQDGDYYGWVDADYIDFGGSSSGGNSSSGSSSSKSTVSSCNKSGEINCHGGTVAGFTTSYVAEGDAVGKVRSSLGDGWHVTAYNTCTSMGITWYELWDSWDGDYYGWVDSSYIDFY